MKEGDRGTSGSQSLAKRMFYGLPEVVSPRRSPLRLWCRPVEYGKCIDSASRPAIGKNIGGLSMILM